MHLRWVIILSGIVAVAAAGGAVSAVPLIRTLQQVDVPARGAPSRELESSRRVVLTSAEDSINHLARRAEQLELLSELLADAAGEDHWRSLGSGGVAFTPSWRLPQAASPN